MAASFPDLPSVQVLLAMVGADGPPAVRGVQELNPDPGEHHPADLDSLAGDPHAGSVELVQCLEVGVGVRAAALLAPLAEVADQRRLAVVGHVVSLLVVFFFGYK